MTTDDASRFDASHLSITTGTANFHTFSEAAVLPAVVIVDLVHNIARNWGRILKTN